MAGGATTTNMDDTFVAATFAAEMLPELRPAVTSKSFLNRAPDGPSTAHSFTLLGDPGASGAMIEGTDFTSVTDITTSKATATASEVGILTTVSDVLMKVSLANAMAVAGAILTRSTLEKWETDVAAVADDFGTSTTASSTLTPQDLLTAISAIEQRDALTGSLVAYLHPKQTGELRNEVIATTALKLAASSGGIPTTGVSGETNGRGYFGELFGVNIWQTSIVAKSASLYLGSVFVSGQCLGFKELWAPRVETERRASLRGNYVVSSACYGLADIEITNRGQMLKSAG